MALAIDGEYVHANLSINKIKNEFLKWKTAYFRGEEKTESFIREYLESFNSVLKSTAMIKKANPELKKDISSFISNLLSGKRIGVRS